ncbi:MAG: hypothetical protein QM569_07385 [Acidovorax sp.]|uniref:hypothetical protein n=1 Tax=Acidovorax sp. TaxID=1872122 RepID=UPI0039E41580
MKTTIELPDALFAEARRFADDNGMTMKALIEQGLRKAMAAKQDKPFKLRDMSVGGDGLTPEFKNASWEQMRDAIYEGRGG